VVVGAPSLANNRRGELLVFKRPASGDWRQAKPVAVLTLSHGLPSGLLGTHLAISGDTIVASDYARPINGNMDQGAVYVFSEPAGGWHSETQSAQLTAADGTADAYLGISVAISGDTIVAGAPGADSRSGRVYTFTRTTGGWSQAHEAELSSETNDGERLGSAVAVSGATIVADAAGETGGVADVFERPPDGWVSTSSPSAVLRPSSREPGLSGPLAMSASTIAATGPTGNDRSSVYVFTRPAAGWRSSGPTAVLNESASHYAKSLGDSIAITGDAILAGDSSYKLTGDYGPGAVFRFNRPASGWRSATETSILIPPAGTPDNDGFGAGTAVSDGEIIVGGPGLLRGSGRIYVAPLAP
jgi:hypothetical protein